MIGSRSAHRQGPVEIFAVGAVGELADKLFTLRMLSPQAIACLGGSDTGSRAGGRRRCVLTTALAHRGRRRLALTAVACVHGQLRAVHRSVKRQPARGRKSGGEEIGGPPAYGPGVRRRTGVDPRAGPAPRRRAAPVVRPTNSYRVRARSDPELNPERHQPTHRRPAQPVSEQERCRGALTMTSTTARSRRIPGRVPTGAEPGEERLVVGTRKGAL